MSIMLTAVWRYRKSLWSQSHFLAISRKRRHYFSV